MELEVITRSPKKPVKPVPLVFVHGAFAGAWIWDEHFLPFFAERGYQAHAISLRGHGESEGAERLLFSSLADYVEDVRRIVQPMEQPPLLIGHSMGGMVAQRYARDHHLRGLVLMASAPPHGLLPSSLTMATCHPLLMQQLTILQTLGPSMVNFPGAAPGSVLRQSAGGSGGTILHAVRRRVALDPVGADVDGPGIVEEGGPGSGSGAGGGKRRLHPNRRSAGNGESLTACRRKSSQTWPTP